VISRLAPKITDIAKMFFDLTRVRKFKPNPKGIVRSILYKNNFTSPIVTLEKSRKKGVKLINELIETCFISSTNGPLISRGKNTLSILNIK
jgi:hypothetical protein